MEKGKKVKKEENSQNLVPSPVVNVFSTRIVKQRYQFLSSLGEKNEGDDMCEPNQAVDVKTLVMRALHGQPLGLSQGALLYDEEDSSDDIGYRPMDKVEMAEEQLRLREKYERSKRRVQEPKSVPNPQEPRSPEPPKEPPTPPMEPTTPPKEPTPPPSE